MISLRRFLILALLAFGLPVLASTPLLNVSYDVAREFYKQYNPWFIGQWKQKSGAEITINQSHGGSSKQARAVIDGLDGDLVTMNQSLDIDAIAEKGLLPTTWAKRLPNNAVPFTSTQLFLVRKGNPKGIKTWVDLTKPGIQVVVPNPKTSGNGRYTYLAAWGQVIKSGGNEAQAKEFVAKLFKNVPVLDTGGRGATTTFVQRNIGDVLVTFENEVSLIREEYGADKFDVVYPPISIEADLPVSIVDKVVDKKGTRAVAEAYLQGLFSLEGQELAAKFELRPYDKTVLAKYAKTLPPLNLFSVDEVFGSLAKAQAVHFKDGGVFDSIYQLK